METAKPLSWDDAHNDWNETERLQALEQYSIVDTGREAQFDDIAEIAADILDAPIAVINFIAADRQWFKAEKGIGKDSLPLDVSICRHALFAPGVFVVPDLTQDSRFDCNPLVNVADGLRFYAGALLQTPDGLPLGTVCVLDTQARPQGISTRQERALKSLAAQTMAQLELRRSNVIAQKEGERLSAMFAQAAVGMSQLGLNGRFLEVNDKLCQILGRSREELLTLSIADVTHRDDIRENMLLIDRLGQSGQSFSVDKRYVRPDGSIVWASSSVTRLEGSGGTDSALAVTADITARKNEERQREFLLNLADQTRNSADPHEVVLATTRALGEELGVARVAYVEIDEAKGAATTFGDWINGGVSHLPATIALRDFGASIVDHLSSGLTLRVTDARSDPVTMDALPGLESIAVRALVSVPLLKDGALSVNLNVHDTSPRLWNNHEVQLIEIVAEKTWEAVKRVRSENKMREMEALHVSHLKQLNQTLEERVEAIAADRERFWSLSQELLGVVDHDGIIVEANAAWRRLLGYEANELVGKSFRSFTHPDDLEATNKKFTETLNAPLVVPYEFRYRAKDGTYRWFAWTATFEDGKVYASGRDVNAEKAQQAELEQMWRNAGDMFVVIDQAGIFLRVNPATTAILGWEENEIVGLPIFDFIHPDDIASSFSALDHALAHGILPTFENRYRAKGGDFKIISWLAAKEGDTIFAYGRDVTSEKQREQALALAQEALRQAQKMEAMGQLTGGVAHDFNNLLTPIVGSLDLLQRRGLGNEREQKLIAGAAQSAERARVLVQRLLAFARRQPLQAVSVDVAKLVAGMGDLVSSTTGPQITVIVDAADDLPPAKADPNQLEMALLNLSVNARDAMPEGGTLRITATKDDVGPNHPASLTPGIFVKISVADSGSGMDDETIARAIEPFFSTKGIGKGTGLGLSMVHGLASQLGGALTIQSNIGLGTIVELWLPMSGSAPAVAVQEIDFGNTSSIKGTVLLVDDEELVRLSTSDMLNDIGYDVIEAASAEDAMRILRDGEHFDLLITDHLMPGMIGTDLASAMTAARPDLPVLLISGYAEREGIDPNLPRLIKPFRKSDLEKSLAEVTSIN